MSNVHERKTNRQSEYEMINRVMALTGNKRAEARVIWLAAMRAIAEALQEGCNVHLKGVGMLRFHYWVPKNRTSGGISAAATNALRKGGYSVKFRVSNIFAETLQGVVPLDAEMPMDASGTPKGRAAKLAAEQAAAGARALV